MEFNAKHWSEYLTKMGIKHVRSTPQHPASNGKVERFNRTFKEMLAKAVNNAPGDWEDYVGSTLFSHRISISDVTKYSPFYLLYGRQPRAPLSKLLHMQDAIQGFWSRVDSLSAALKTARTNSEDARKFNKARLAKKANDGLINPGDMVVLLAAEPLTLTSRWDPQWQVTRVSGTTISLRHQQSGQIKKVHRSKVKVVDPDMVWDDVNPRPRRKQGTRAPQGVRVDIHVDPPQVTMQPPGGDPQVMGNPPPSDDPQPSTSSEDVDMAIEDTDGDHPYTLASPASTPVILPEVSNELAPRRPIRGRLPVAGKSGRGERSSYKRELSPPEIITPRHNTRWNSLSDEEKRRKRVRYDILAGRTTRTFDCGGVFTV